MKKCVELQVATKPRSSSISASSAPASIAWMQARMQLSFECELSFWSCSAGPVRRMWTVNRSSPRANISGRGRFHSGMMTMVARADRQARVLIGRALDAARDHQPDVHAVRHAVGLDDVEQARLQRLAAQADVDAQHLRPVPQPVEMAVEKGDAPVDEAQALPHAVAEHEAGIEHGDLRLLARRQRSVDADQDGIVARVAVVILRSGGKARAIRHDSLCVFKAVSMAVADVAGKGDFAARGRLEPRSPALSSPPCSGRERRD